MRYSGPLLDENELDESLKPGQVTVNYSKLVSWLTDQLRTYTKLEEQVNPITGPDDFSSFMLELSGFLREYGCPHPTLTEGPMNQRLDSPKSKKQLLDYLLSELCAVKMLALKKPEVLARATGSTNTVAESELAGHLKEALVVLGFPKPPANITAGQLMQKFIPKVQEIVSKVPGGHLGKPMLKSRLSDKQWSNVMAMNEAMSAEYRIRREMLLKRLDVTIQSFQWSQKAQRRQDEVAAVYQPIRKQLVAKSEVKVKDILAARDDLLRLEKTSAGVVREAGKCAINKVIMGTVPDRGGRAWEQEPPPPEMPSFMQRQQGAPRGGGGDRGRGGGRGGGGGYQQQQQSQSFGYQGYNQYGHQGQGGHQGQQGGYQGHQGGYQQQGGYQGQQGHYQGQQGGYNQGRGGYQGNQGGGYQGNQGGGYQQRGGSAGFQSQHTYGQGGSGNYQQYESYNTSNDYQGSGDRGGRGGRGRGRGGRGRGRGR